MEKIAVENLESALTWLAIGVVAGFVAVFVTSYIVTPVEKATGLTLVPATAAS
jgi:hypothetical protein